jgi:hypothetical protein
MPMGENCMREIKTEINISAPPEKVWTILADLNQWKHWNPIINDTSGNLSVGSRLKIVMRGKGDKSGQTYHPVITELEAPIRFEWSAIMLAGFIFKNGKSIELERHSTGTRLIHKETFGGIMVPLMWRQMEKAVPPMLRSMNDALKGVVERSE